MIKEIKLPNDRPTFDGEIATYWFEGNMLVSLSKSIKRTAENIASNAEFVKKITGGRQLPLLIYIAKSPMPDKAARKLSAELLPKNYKAMAMVSEPGLSQFIMKMVFTFKPSPIPVKNFGNDNEAREWLKQFV